jgi:hypothetical protein
MSHGRAAVRRRRPTNAQGRAALAGRRARANRKAGALPDPGACFPTLVGGLASRPWLALASRPWLALASRPWLAHSRRFRRRTRASARNHLRATRAHWLGLNPCRIAHGSDCATHWLGLNRGRIAQPNRITQPQPGSDCATQPGSDCAHWLGLNPGRIAQPGSDCAWIAHNARP